jgi:hypothetical protein
MDSTQEAQIGSRETEKSEAWQILQSEGNKAARRLFTASPTIRGACGFPFGMLSQLLLKTGLLWKAPEPADSLGVRFIPTPVCSSVHPVYTILSPPARSPSSDLQN